MGGLTSVAAPAAPTLLYHRCDAGQMMSGAWFPSSMTFRIKPRKLNLSFIEPDDLASHCLRVFSVLCFTPGGLHVSFTVARVQSGQNVV